MAELPKPRFCPACDKEYPNWKELTDHLKKAMDEGDEFHIDVIMLEDWPLVGESATKGPDEENMT